MYVMYCHAHKTEHTVISHRNTYYYILRVQVQTNETQVNAAYYNEQKHITSERSLLHQPNGPHV